MILALLVIVAVVILGLVFFKVLKNTFKAFSLLFFVLLFIVIILGFFFVQDFQGFTQSFREQPTAYLLDDDGSLIAGFTLRKFNFSTFQPLPFDELNDYLQNDSDQITVVVKRSALDSSLRTNMTQGYSLAQTIESPDYQLRASGFMIGVAQMIRSDSPFQLVRLVRKEKVALFPETFMIKVLTFDSREYKKELEDTYQLKKEEVYDKLGVRKEVNST